MKKILLVDVGGLWYFRMLRNSLESKADVTVVTKYYTDQENVYSYFFPLSERMKDGSKLRKIFRGVEYYLGCIRTLRLVKREKFDIIHVQWALVPVIDKMFFKRAKKYVKKLVYTAHDVIPHDGNKNKIKQLGSLYQEPDCIIVHGYYCKLEMHHYFPQISKKVYIQKHGVYEKKETTLSEKVKKKHGALVKRKNTVIFSVIGQIGEHKGVDLVLKAWKKYQDLENVTLLVAGKTLDPYKEKFKQYEDYCKNTPNIYFYNQRFDAEEENLFYSISDIILLPYRKASMSGVVFSAVQYNKTILTTGAGCIREYVESALDHVIFCKPYLKSVEKAIGKILDLDNPKSQLREMGIKFSDIFYKLYDWDDITDKLIDEVYS